MPEPSPALRFFGFFMITVGALMTFLSGTCTLVFFTMGLQQKVHRGDMDLFWGSLLLGLPFIAIGIGLILGGRALTRRNRPKEPPSEVF